jgi:hypothetical protein
MYKFKDVVKTTLVFIGMMAFLSGFLVLNGLHYAGAF